MNNSNEFPILPLIIYQVGYLYHQTLRECDKNFRAKALPLQMDQIPVLFKLYYQGGASQQEISTALLRDKASVNRTISFLHKKDIVKVIQNVTDKRKTVVELTANGKKLAKQALAIIEEFDGYLSSALTKEERIQFPRLMQKLIDTATFK